MWEGEGLSRQSLDTEEDLWTKRHLVIVKKWLEGQRGGAWDSDLLHRFWASLGLLF